MGLQVFTMKPLSKEVKDLLVDDRARGMEYKKLAEKYKISISGARKIVEKHKLLKTTASFKNLCGRKRKTTTLDDRKIVIEAKKCPLNSAREIKEATNLNISSRTVQRRLVEAGLKSFFAKKKPLLRAANIKKRLCFAKKYVGMPESFWNRIIWSDESKFELKNSKKRKRVRCEPSKRLNSRDITPTVKHGGGSLMVWGCFSAAGVGQLVKITSKMTGEYYVNILQENLAKSSRDMCLGDYIFQQDNDPKHTSKVAKKYFMESGTETLEWPAQSPDLNPIEHLWTILDDKIPFEARTNLDSFWRRMQEEWTKIPTDTLKNLVRSIPKRLAEVIKNKGAHTKY